MFAISDNNETQKHDRGVTHNLHVAAETVAHLRGMAKANTGCSQSK